jgi:hypothetical protein
MRIDDVLVDEVIQAIDNLIAPTESGKLDKLDGIQSEALTKALERLEKWLAARGQLGLS